MPPGATACPPRSLRGKATDRDARPGGVSHATRTIADLDTSDPIRPHHLNEAINYRMLDRQMWT